MEPYKIYCKVVRVYKKTVRKKKKKEEKKKKNLKKNKKQEKTSKFFFLTWHPSPPQYIQKNRESAQREGLEPLSCVVCVINTRRNVTYCI